ncbi:MAG: hypothetical protein RR954_10160 [Christensenellaceae bacterium]
MSIGQNNRYSVAALPLCYAKGGDRPLCLPPPACVSFLTPKKKPSKIYIIVAFAVLVGSLIGVLSKNTFSWYDKRSPEEFANVLEEKSI